MVIRTATRADVISLCGDSYLQSMRALVVEHDGEPIAIAGVLHTSPAQCFSVMTDKVRTSPKTIVKCAMQIRDILNRYTVPVYAIASDDEPTSERFLHFVGFEYFNTTQQGKVYKWPIQ